MSRSATGALLLVLLVGSLSGYENSADETPAEKTADSENAPASNETIDPLSVNATCYVCHIPFVREEISRVHFAEKITCIKCHGLSAAHANDEDVGATKPDITFRRDQVDAMCTECHEGHDAPASDVIVRFLERKLNATDLACTDCHGHHRIEQPTEQEGPDHD